MNVLIETPQPVLKVLTILLISGVFILYSLLNLYANEISYQTNDSKEFIQPQESQVKSLNNPKPEISYLDKIRKHLREIFSFFKKKVEKKDIELFSPQDLGIDTDESIFETEGTTLDKCIGIALANNLDAQIAQDQIKLSKLKMNEALRAMLPAASLKYEQRNAKLDQPYEGKEYNIEVEQPIFYSGELKYAYLQAKANLEASQINLQRVKSDLLVDIVKAYYGLLRNKLNLKYQKDLIKETKKDFELAKSEFDHDIIPNIEFLDIQSLFNQVSYQYKLAEKDLALSEINFRQVLNLGPQEEIDIEPVSDFPDIKDNKSELDIDIDLEECLGLALDNHWELKLNKLLVKSSKYGRNIANSKGWPKFSLVGRYGKGAEAYDTSDLKLENEWFLGAKMTWSFGGSTIDYIYSQEETFPTISRIQSTEGITQTAKISLLDNLQYFSNKKEAEVNHKQTINRLQNVEQKIASEIKESYFNLQKALIEIKGSKNEREFKEKQLAILELKRKSNEASISEVLSARVELARAKISYIDSIVNYYLSLATLNKAIGISGYQEKFKLAAR